MKTKKLAFALALGIVANPIWADRIGGSARADFRANELVIPCVQLKNYVDDDRLEGLYFDVRLERRGSSFNYELVEAIQENSDVCRRIAALAAFEDDDYDDSDDDSDDDKGFSRSDPVGGGKATRLFVGCEIDDDDDDDDDRESKIEIKVLNLAPGDYRARVISGGIAVDSLGKAASRFETEFKFKSDTDDRDKTLIAADFIQNNAVTGEILDANGQVILSANAICKVDN
jgi:hypothetical protein